MILNHTKNIFGKETIDYIKNDYHTLVLGSTGSGKSRRLVLPSIANLILERESIVVTDPKGEVYLYTMKFLEKQGYTVKVIDFNDPSKSDSYNPLQPTIDAINDNKINEAISLARELVTILAPSNDKGEKIWTNGERSVITSAILAIVHDNKDKTQYQNMANVYKFIVEMCGTIGEEIPLTEYIENLPSEHPANIAIKTAQLAPFRTRASFNVSALTTLELFAMPSLHSILSTSDFELEDVGKKPVALFFIVPDSDKKYYPIVSIMINQLYMSLVKLGNKYGGRILNRVNYILDEFGNFPKIENLDSTITVSRSRGVRLNFFLQDFAQLEEKYGKNVSRTLRGNCQRLIYLKSDDYGTRKEISELLGKYDISAKNISNNNKWNDLTINTSTSNASRPLLTPSEVGQIKSPYSIIIGGTNPYIGHLPDISKTIFNKMLGLGDEEHNQKLRYTRQLSRVSKDIENLQIEYAEYMWLPLQENLYRELQELEEEYI